MSGVGYERLRPALEMLASQIAEVDLERAASACALSPRHFSRLFKQVFHMPFTDYVRERRLNSAAQHLTTTDRQVAQIAYELGFVAPAHFATLFRQRFGVSPVQYRAKGQRTH
jgi:transcriptional regulator GlxA family with amidase domain